MAALFGENKKGMVMMMDDVLVLFLLSIFVWEMGVSVLFILGLFMVWVRVRERIGEGSFSWILHEF